MPPIVASAPGSTQNAVPVLASALFNCRCVTPASTVASRSSALTRSTRFMRDRSRDTPPCTGLTCPSSELPAPKGTTGAPWRAATRTTALTSSVRERKHHGVGLARRVPRLAVSVMLELRLVGAAAVAEGVREVAHERRAALRGENRGHRPDIMRVASMPSPFTAKTLSFLRALKRNNDREWFRARKDDYERHVRGPMLALIARLAGDLKQFAPEAGGRPEAVALPDLSRHTLQRRQDAAQDQRRGRRSRPAASPATRAPGSTWRSRQAGCGWAAGCTCRRRSRSTRSVNGLPGRTRSCTASSPRASSAAVLGELQGDQLTRVPRGYLKDHPAAEYLRYKQFLGFREFEPALCHERPLLPGARAHVQGAHAAGAIPQHGNPRRCRSGSGPAGHECPLIPRPSITRASRAGASGWAPRRRSTPGSPRRG